MNYSEEIFEKLHIKPDEEFEIKDSSFIYRLTEKLIFLASISDRNNASVA